MEVDEDSQPNTSDSVVTIARDGVLTGAGQIDQRLAQQRATPAHASQDSDVLLMTDTAQPSIEVVRPRASRALPAPPSDRGAMEWNISLQKHKGKHASCRACCLEFASDESRFARSTDTRAGTSRYLHAACVPGGFHPQDNFTGPAAAEQVAMDLVSCFRGTAEQDMVTELQPQLPSLPPMAGEEWWSAMPWDAVFHITTDTLIDIPSSTRMAYALFKNDVVTQCLEAGSSASASSLWKKLSFLDSLILNSRRAEDESQAQSVVRRLQQASDEDWQSLWSEATLPKRRSSVGVTQNADAQARAQAKFVRDVALSGEPGRALKALRKRLPIVRDPARADEVQKLFPRSEAAQMDTACPVDHQWTQSDIDDLSMTIVALLQKKRKRTAPGVLGGRLEHWHVLQLADDGAKTAGRLLAHLALGLVPEDVIAAHARCEVVPSEKPGNSGLRPMQLGSVCRRIAMSGIVKFVKADVQVAVGPDQLGIGAQDGCAKAFQAMQSKCRLQPQRVILAEDCKAAHQHLERPYAAQQLERHCPKLLQPFLVWYGRVSKHSWHVASGDSISISAERGLDQGDPIANPVFALALVDISTEFRTKMLAEDPGVSVIQIADDIHICTVPGALRNGAVELRRLWATAGLSFNTAKQETWCLSEEPLPGPFQTRRVAQLRCLGNTLEQMTDETEQTLPQLGAEIMGNDLRRASEKVTKLADSINNAVESGLPRQVGQGLFRYAAAGQTQHIIAARQVPQTAALAYDECLRDAWGKVLNLPLTDAAWSRGNLPLRHGGCSFGAIEHRAAAAFIACWSRTHSYTCRHVGASSAAELLVSDAVLGGELRGSAGAVRLMVPRLFSVPWEDGQPPVRPIRQRELMANYYATARKTLLDTMGEHQAGVLRSCGGPGAGGFLMQQTDANVIMDDDRFKVAVARRFGGGLRPAARAPMPCRHAGPRGSCAHQIDESGIHCGTCNVGGYAIERHDRAVRWLHQWLSQGRCSTPPQMEQVLPSEQGRLDITFMHDGVAQWIDVAITSVTSSCPRTRAVRSRKDGAAARAEEAVKRSRYRNRAQPFVLEAHGRPGRSALAFVRAFAGEAAVGASESASDAWAALSSISQSGTAWIEMTAYGKNCMSNGTAEIWFP